MYYSRFRAGRDFMSGFEWREEMTERFAIWDEVTGALVAA